MQDYEGALKYANLAIEKNPDNIEAYIERANSNNFLGNYDEAIKDLSNVIQIQPANAIAFNMRAWALYKKKDYPGAEAAIKDYLATDPKDVIGNHLLARIYEKEHVLQLLVTFALFMILEDLQKLVWGVQPLFEDAPVRLLGQVQVGEIYYTAYQLLLLPGVALLVLLSLSYFLRRTLLGRTIVAVTHDREAAAAIGIDARRVYLLTFTLGAALAALGGALAAPTTSLVPGIGVQMIVLSFAVVATAGLGQIEGAAVTALLIGLGRSLAVYFAPELEVVVPYLLMVAVLLLRPAGLFGRTELRRV